MLPLLKNYISKYRKFEQKILHVHLHNIRALVKFHEKPILCVIYTKKKVYLVKFFIFSTEFCLFYTRPMISRFFMKRLSEHIAREDVRANF
jgi:hypothetical protein